MEDVVSEELYHRIALTRTTWIGDKTARNLLQYFGTAKEVFHAPASRLAALENFGAKRVGALKAHINKEEINQELSFISTHKIQPLFYTDPLYPQRLNNCADAPIMLYYKGNADLNAARIISVIGTRKHTDYGLRITEEFITGLQEQGILVISGLAYGIDAIAHRKALDCGLPTVGVLAHGLDRIYPAMHKNLAKAMIQNGGLLSEYISGTHPDKQNFPMRNRIVAGMADVTVVVETDIKGGAMITAKLAAGYHRDVAAFPGRTIDVKSSGCNYLIRSNIAQMITQASELMEMMNWEPAHGPRTRQQALFRHFNDEERVVTELLAGQEPMHIEELFSRTTMNRSLLAATLLGLEMDGVVKSLPGKRYMGI